MAATNIVYFTSRCNFDCEYCYEHHGESQAQHLFTLSEEEALKNIDEIIDREPDPSVQTMIVLFGGEPTLNWEVVKKAVRYAYSRKQNVYFCLSTNGWKFRKPEFCQDFLKLSRDVSGQIGVDLSFDGIGNFRRKLRGGKSVDEGMYEVFKNIARYGIPYNLRYTVHAGNVDHCKEDIINLDKFFRPIKFVTSFDVNHIGAEATLRAKESLREAWKEGLITRPVCELVCDMCQKCIKGKGNAYWTKDGNIRNLVHGENANVFEDF